MKNSSESGGSKSCVLSLIETFDFTLLLSFLKDLVEYVNIYGALLLVESMMTTGELISVVKLSFC